MEILSKPCGDFMTNCYILKGKSGEIVIDPGQGSFAWITQNTDRILAVLNTHGHFDHTFDDDWKECLIYQAVQMGSVEDYINNAPNNGMWKLIFKILDETYSPDRYLELQQYVSKEPM